MADIFKLWPARAAIVDPKTGLATTEFLKALARITQLLGGANGTLPISFVYVPVGGTANGIVILDGSGAVTSTGAPTNGQILIGRTGNTPALGTITGTANRVSVSNGSGTVTLSTPQDTDAGASPTFAGMTISGLTANSFAYSGAGGAMTSTTAPTNGQLLIGSTGSAPVKAALTGTANRVTVTNSAGGITLSAPQDLATTSSVTFGSVTSTGAFGCNGATAQAAATVNAAISATAGLVYTATEQTLINDLKALVNQLRAALVANGITV